MLLLQQFEICIQIEIFVSEEKGKDGEATIFTEMSLSQTLCYIFYLHHKVHNQIYLFGNSFNHSFNICLWSISDILCTGDKTMNKMM